MTTTACGAQEEGEPNRRASQQQNDHDSVRAIRRIHRAVSRGAALGLIIRGGTHAATAIAAAIRKRSGKGTHPGDRAVDALRWAAFLGAFGGVYVGVDESIRKWIGPWRSASFRAAVAGLAAGPMILLTGWRVRHDDLALYIFLRGLTLLVRCGNEPTAPAWLRAALTPTRWEHGDVALMCAASWQILYSYVMLPQTLPAGYIHFLNKMSGVPAWTIPAIKELGVRNVTTPGLLAPLEMLADTKFSATLDPHFHELLHGHIDCDSHFWGLLPILFKRSLSVYLPVYSASTLAVQRSSLFTWGSSLSIIGKMFAASARSSAFLALYIASAHRALCFGTAALPWGPSGQVTPGKLAAIAWIPGLATLLEKKSRRMELALYCTCRALLSFYQSLVAWRAAPRWILKARTDVLTFSVACACILHCYSDGHGRHRPIFRRKYVNVLDFVFGGAGMDTGSISHVNSTRELLSAAHFATRRQLKSLSANNLLLVVRKTVGVQVGVQTAPASVDGALPAWDVENSVPATPA